MKNLVTKIGTTAFQIIPVNRKYLVSGVFVCHVIGSLPAIIITQQLGDIRSASSFPMCLDLAVTYM